MGTISFCGGFLAQRALYDFVQVPFVFVDYWAYAETGLVAATISISLLLTRPLWLLLLLVVAAVIVFSLESARFRKFVFRPSPSLAFSFLLLVLVCASVRQQLAVRELRARDHGAVGVAVPRSTVPAVFPFTLAIPEAIEPPPVEAVPDVSSIEVWFALGAELDRQLSQGASYLEVRPRPSWALSVDPESMGSAHALLGNPVADSRLDANRARKLYRLILTAQLFSVLGLYVGGLWHRRVRARLAAGKSVRGDRAGDGASGRLGEELWFYAGSVVRPLTGLILVVSMSLLMPECYGLLAMPRFGQEYVQVVGVDAQEGQGQSSDSDGQVGTKDLGAIDSLTRDASEVLAGYQQSGGERSQRIRWEQLISRVERAHPAVALEVLGTMSSIASLLAPDLAFSANEAKRALEKDNRILGEGFLLHYPRSETEYLRILQPNPGSPSRKWTLVPISMDRVGEVRVLVDKQSALLANHLKQLAKIGPERRATELYQAELTGHHRLLEVAIGGTFDPWHRIRGFSITDIGRFAAALGDSREARQRKAVALERLLSIVADETERPDHRSGATTALYRFVPTGDERACRGLEEVLEHDGSSGAWEVAGTAMTAIGKLRCRDAVPRLIESLSDEATPRRVAATIPTQLANLGPNSRIIPALADVLKDPRSPVDVLGPAITAISLVAAPDYKQAVDALIKFIAEAHDLPLVVKEEVLSDYRVTAVDSLRMLGDPRALSSLQSIARDDEDETVRAKAIVALAEFDDSSSETILIETAEDQDVSRMLRGVAIEASGSFHDNRVARRLADLFDQVDRDLQVAVVGALRERGRSGSGFSQGEALRLEQRLGAFAGGGADGAGSGRSAGGVPGPQESRIRLGETVPGRLGEGDIRIRDGSYVDNFLLEAKRGTTITAVLRSDEFDAFLWVMGPGMSEPVADDDGGGGCNSRVEFTPPEDGVFLLAVSSALEGPAPGAYQLSVSEGTVSMDQAPCQM